MPSILRRAPFVLFGLATAASADTPPGAAEAPARTVLGALARLSPFAGHLGATGSLSAFAAGYRPTARPVPGALDATLPASGRMPAHLGVAGSASLFIELAPIASKDPAAELVDGAAVYRDAALDTDVVWVFEPAAVEELRVLRTPRAPTHARYRVSRGSAVADLRVKRSGADEDVIEVLDQAGEVRLASAPMFAMDARGVRRGVHAELRRTGDGLELETSFDAEGMAYPIVVDPAWSTVAPMGTARVNHTATTLPGDRVLVTGGHDGTTYFSTAEIYDVAAKTWTSTAPMGAKRSGHTATLLSDGRVLVVGGTADGSNSVSTAALYDIAKKTWSPAAAMAEVRTRHTATLLSGDKVLVTGGTDFSPGGESNTGAIYDAATNAWAAAGTMSLGRQEHTATLLASGKVLVAGGRRGGGVYHVSTDLFDPTPRTWSKVGDLATARGAHTATLLSSGKVLVAGGRGFDKYAVMQTWSSAEVYDPTTKAWGVTPPMVLAREGHTAAALPLDRVLVVGGDGGKTGSVELYELSADRFVKFPGLTLGRTNHATAQLANLDLLVTGGTASAVTANVEHLSLGPLGASCADGLAECASGLCVDGVCCDGACTGQCEACDLAASKGTCTAVTGAPHGARTPCSDGAGVTCMAKHCDGADRKSCAGFADATTTCAPASCADGSAKSAAKCDGKGTCPAAAVVSCAPYACGGGLCKTSCLVDADCSGSNVCDAKTKTCIESKPSTCTADGLSSQPLDTSKPVKPCAPYRCEAKTGNCYSTCTTSDACAPGAACDPATGTCVAAAGGTSDGGCALGTPVGSSGLGALSLLLISAARRRRRAQSL